ncbi:MAG: S41 family peptidase [Marinilabiliales bacterium]|nr:S41 family peptidase [Marinilabiliales bacterium]
MENKSRLSTWLPLIVALTLIFGVWLGIKLQTRRLAALLPTQLSSKNKLDMVINLVEGNYVDTVNSRKMVEDAIPEVLKQLDPHTVYIPARDMQGVTEEMTGNFGGIGVQFSIQNDTVMVIDVVSGGPSQKLGIMAGDRIVKVGDSTLVGKNVKNDLVFKKLRGPKGTNVKVSILRKGLPDLLSFNITRGDIPINSVDVSYMIDNQIGYIKIGRFAERTYEEYMAALAKLDSAGAGEIIIDLRGNPGGYLSAVIRMVNEVLDQNELIVYTIGRTQPKREYRAENKGRYFGRKVVVLVDEYTASASEIFAGALQDNDRGTVIGRRTFGKGLVQEQIPFFDGSAIRLTVARYYTPSGRCIQRSYLKGTDDYYADITRRYVHGEFEQKDSIHPADTVKYYTRLKRVVYGGGGIMPDLFVPADTSGNSSYLFKLLQKGLVYQYAFNYADKHREELKKLKSGAEFVSLLKKRNLLAEFLQYASQNGVATNEQGLKASGKIIETQLMAYVARNIIGEEGFYSIISDIDNTLQEAVKTLHGKEKLVSER